MSETWSAAAMFAACVPCPISHESLQAARGRVVAARDQARRLPDHRPLVPYNESGLLTTLGIELLRAAAELRALQLAQQMPQPVKIEGKGLQGRIHPRAADSRSF